MTENDYSQMLPPLLSGRELIERLKEIPEYDPLVREYDMASRLIKLSEIYRIYMPSAMSVEVYNKLYLAAAMSLKKKNTRLMVCQQSSNYKAMQGNCYRGIIGGADSFTIIGTSGIGKSSAIDRAIQLMGSGGIIETEQPYAKIIPCLVVQCPFDCSSKGMLLEILRMVDIVIDTKYYERSQRAGVTTDILIGTVAQVAANHIGVLIIDEIQHIAGHKRGKALVGMLTQLINSSGVSICMVGTPDCIPFFEQAMQLARRSMGLKYSTLPCDDYFRDFCHLVYRYQYVHKAAELSDAVIEWIYEHSAGVVSVVVSLIHDAQELAIFSGRELLDIQALNEAFIKRLTMLHGFVTPQRKQERHSIPDKFMTLPDTQGKDTDTAYDYLSIPEIVKKAKNGNMGVVSLLKDYITVMEVPL